MANRDDSPSGALFCWVVAAVFAAGLAHLAVNLRHVQVTAAADYNYASARQSVRRVQMAGIRGRILDSRGGVLAGNRLSLSIVCRPSSFRERTAAKTVESICRGIEAVGAAIGRPSPLSESSVSSHVHRSLAMPLTVWRDIGGRELAVFSEHEDEFPGFEIAESAERVYPRGPLAAHIVGYVGRDRGAAVAGDERFSYFAPEMRGRAGLESHYDAFLRGVPGEKKVLVDARGFAIREWTVVAARPGPDLATTVDVAVQRAAEEQLRGEVGACAVIDPRTGAVLALASSPGFDPNAFVPGVSAATYAKVADDPGKPFLNRAVAGAYAPGSTFKPVTALAALGAGLDPDEPYLCEGSFSWGEMTLRCTSRWGHGDIDLRRALMKSCNPYFCHVAMDAGTNALCAAARELGLGSKTGVDCGFERGGVVPDGTFKMQAVGERWYPGDLAQMAIGQGMLLATPLQMARLAGAIGTGRLATPHIRADAPVETKPLSFPQEHLAAVREGMRLVVEGDGEAHGTGWRAEEGLGFSVSGKTGTAEVGAGERRRKNAWFIAYAPSDAPVMAVALVVENGESGGTTAAPKVREILRAAFGRAGS